MNACATPPTINTSLNYTARQKGINDFSPLVRSISSRLIRRLPANIDREDLNSIGFIGLIEAYDRFDRSKGVPFPAYAELRVRGAMIDYLRKQDWVPRSVRRRADTLENIRIDMRQKKGSKPSESELAAALGLSLEGLANYRRDSQISRFISLDSPAGGEENSSLYEMVAADGISPEEQLEEEQLKDLVWKEIERLPEREMQAVQLYYFQKKNLKEIGAFLGVTESRACQIRTAAVRGLRNRIRRIVTA